MGARANNYKLQEFFHMKKVISQASKGGIKLFELAWFHQLYRSHLHNLRHAGLTCQKKIKLPFFFCWPIYSFSPSIFIFS
jgi:hypothetical protein